MSLGGFRMSSVAFCGHLCGHGVYWPVVRFWTPWRKHQPRHYQIIEFGHFRRSGAVCEHLCGNGAYWPDFRILCTLARASAQTLPENGFQTPDQLLTELI